MGFVRRKSEDDCWMFILLLTTLTILIESLKSYTFDIFDISLSFAIFLLPFVYFLVDYITKKYDYKKGIAAIAISAVMFVSFSAIMSFALGETFLISSVSGEFCGYVVSQFIHLSITLFLINHTKYPTWLVYINYLFSLIIYHLFYTLIYLNMIILESYWIEYFMTLGIQALVCVFTVFFDHFIRREIEE